MSKPIISIDFDGTLTRPEVQEFIINNRYRVDFVILTARYDELHKHLYSPNPDNSDLYNLVSELDLPLSRIYFTNMRPKWEFLKGTKVIAHLDDMSHELLAIDYYLWDQHGLRTVDVTSDAWIDNLNTLINRYYNN
ncbi:HAD family hydrolase [Elizabethkingia phage TCUEAP1]|nr:HAD family hydrolase [Elizabethkingia phage TCUEAP1]